MHKSVAINDELRAQLLRIRKSLGPKKMHRIAGISRCRVYAWGTNAKSIGVKPLIRLWAYIDLDSKNSIHYLSAIWRAYLQNHDLPEKEPLLNVMNQITCWALPKELDEDEQTETTGDLP